MQTPQDHVVVIVVLQVQDDHAMKDLTIGSQNIARPRPHTPPCLTTAYILQSQFHPHRCRRKFDEMSSISAVVTAAAISSSHPRPPVLSRPTLRYHATTRSVPLSRSAITVSMSRIVSPLPGAS